MATAEEILAGMPETQAEEAVCIIDPDTRIITVPQTLQLFGVESDQEAEKIPFRSPRIVGNGIDLSTCKLRINFQNANGELDIYEITDTAVDGADITFSWLLSRKVTAYKGAVAFAFCAREISDGVVTREWNTTINKECKCLEGLEAEAAIVSQNPDVLESILTRLDILETYGGGTGTGTPGKQVELRNSGTAIQWRYTGDTTWTDLVRITDITGPAGEPGPQGEPGETGPAGKDGENGITPHIGENGNWFLGTTDTGVQASAAQYDVLIPETEISTTQTPWMIGSTQIGYANVDRIELIEGETYRVVFDGETCDVVAKAGSTDRDGNVLYLGNLYIESTTAENTEEPFNYIVSATEGFVEAIYGTHTFSLQKKETGVNGKSAYEYAVNGGYTGTEEEFAQKLAKEYAELIEKITTTDTSATVELQPNKLYVFPQAMESLTITLGNPEKTDIANEYHFMFISGTTPTALSIPDGVLIPDNASVEANKAYEMSIMEGCLTYQSWEAVT